MPYQINSLFPVLDFKENGKMRRQVNFLFLQRIKFCILPEVTGQCIIMCIIM